MNLEVELRAIQASVEGPVHVVIEATWGWYWATGRSPSMTWSPRYLIRNPMHRYSISSYTAVPNPDGTCTVRIKEQGTGDNAIPTMGKSIYAVMRAYQPVGTVEFPPIHSD